MHSGFMVQKQEPCINIKNEYIQYLCKVSPKRYKPAWTIDLDRGLIFKRYEDASNMLASAIVHDNDIRRSQRRTKNPPVYGIKEVYFYPYSKQYFVIK